MTDPELSDLCGRLTGGGRVSTLELAGASARVTRKLERLADAHPEAGKVVAEVALLLSSMLLAWVAMARKAGAIVPPAGAPE